MEIITGVGRRRRWQVEDKLRIVAGTEQPGAWQEVERTRAGPSMPNTASIPARCSTRTCPAIMDRIYTRVILATMSGAPHVLDGSHHHVHQTDLRIAEHYTDTAGATDHVFGLCHPWATGLDLGSRI
jgi:hypothetical protein